MENIQAASPFMSVIAEQVNLGDKSQKTEKNTQNAKVLDNNTDNKYVKEKDSKNPSKTVDFTQLAKKLESIINDNETTVEFSVDKDTKKMIFKLLDKNSKEVIHQYPPEVSLKIARMVSQEMDQDAGAVTNAIV